MKKVLLTLLSLLFTSLIIKAQVGIGTDTPNENAVFQVVSTTNNQGILIPSMSTEDRDANISSLSSDEDGLLIYNTTEKCYNYYQSSMDKFVWRYLC